MARIKSFMVLAVAMLAAVSANSAAPTSAPEEASIAFADQNIWSWQVLDNQTMLIETNAHQWYKAKLLGFCTDLPFVERLGFKFNPDNSFDKFSSIEVRGQRCPLVSLVKTAAPSKKGKKPAAATAASP